MLNWHCLLEWLAPEIQEKLLFLPRVERGRDDELLKELQKMAAVREWAGQWGVYMVRGTTKKDIV